MNRFTCLIAASVLAMGPVAMADPRQIEVEMRD